MLQGGKNLLEIVDALDSESQKQREALEEQRRHEEKQLARMAELKAAEAALAQEVMSKQVISVDTNDHKLRIQLCV